MDKMNRLWTKQARDCYNRGCICRGCEIKENYNFPCCMKYAVIDLVRKFGQPVEPERIPKLSEAEREIIEIIKNGYYTIDEITEACGKNRITAKGLLCTLYKKAERQFGAKFKRKTKRAVIFPQFIEFVKNGGFDVEAFD